MRNKKGMVIPWETADSITLANLEDIYESLSEQVAEHEELGSYMHPDDYTYLKLHIMPAVNVLIKYFGG